MNNIKLWLDDIRPMPPYYTHWAKTVQEAIELLKTNNVVECSLDHDLGQGETGYDLAKWIENHAHNGFLQPIRCKIHSQNPVGKQNMQMALANASHYWEK